MALIDRPQEDQFDANEASRKLGISVKLLMQLVKTGRIRFINVAGPGSTRPRYRFTDYILKHFQSMNQKREAEPCPSTSKKARHSTATTLSSNVVAFSALPKPETKKTPSKSKRK